MTMPPQIRPGSSWREIDGEIAGYITTRLNAATQIGGIPNLAVLPKFQRRGIGRKLIEKALAYLQAEGMLYARIETLDQNPVGMQFLSRHGLYRSRKADSLYPTVVEKRKRVAF